MEILAKESDWIHTDAENWAAFLETETGRRLIPAIAQHIPSLLEGGEINAILIRSGQVLAFQKTIEALLTLAHPAPPVPVSASEYPPLEDDRAWNDGNTLTQIPPPENKNE